MEMLLQVRYLRIFKVAMIYFLMRISVKFIECLIDPGIISGRFRATLLI